jgi:hypothetical protein
VRHSSACLALCVAGLLLSACGFTSSPAEGLQFQPPAGWKSSPGIMGFMQFWRPPVDDGEMLMLVKSPKPLEAKEVFSNSQMHGTLKDVTIQDLRTIQICGNQSATLLQAQGTSSSRPEKDQVEMIMSNAGGSSYFAMYVRPLGTPANPQASVAVRQLCLKP